MTNFCFSLMVKCHISGLGSYFTKFTIPYPVLVYQLTLPALEMYFCLDVWGIYAFMDCVLLISPITSLVADDKCRTESNFYCCLCLVCLWVACHQKNVMKGFADGNTDRLSDFMCHASGTFL